MDVIEYWLETPIKLDRKYETPGGSKVSVVSACVDIQYAIKSGKLKIVRVSLSSRGSTIIGSDRPLNHTSNRTGEAWFATGICTPEQLRDAALADARNPESDLRRTISKHIKALKREKAGSSMAAALNSGASISDIEQLLAGSVRSIDLTFTYTKANGTSDIRTATAIAVKGDSLRARDHKDQKVKSFRVDRISNSRQL